MPLVNRSSFPGPPIIQFNGHLQTIFPAFRKVGLNYERERLDLPDGDFLDLDWVDRGSKKLVILSHGLEGSSDRPYMKGMARYFSDRGWDVLAWNCRSCGGEMNLSFRLYHHGDTEDIHEVIRHALRTKDYAQVSLIGFSMGGSIILKYLGVHGTAVPAPIRAAVAFSSPCDLRASAETLEIPGNRIYRKRFLKNLRIKIEIKARQFPGRIDLSHFDDLRKWEDFDHHYSAPLNGYKDAEDFYQHASAKNFMAGIRIPTLLVNAQNDPILTPACSPEALCRDHSHILLERPRRGGHVGFLIPKKEYAWSERRAYEFVIRHQ